MEDMWYFDEMRSGHLGYFGGSGPLDGDLCFGLVYIFTLRHWSGAWYDDKQRAKRYTRQRILLIGLELGLERLR
jgi:hypothetical protein